MLIYFQGQTWIHTSSLISHPYTSIRVLPFFFFLSIRYKRDQDVAFLATCSLHNLLHASLLSESGPPLLDFEVCTLYHVLLFLMSLSVLKFQNTAFAKVELVDVFFSWFNLVTNSQGMKHLICCKVRP